MKFCMSCHRTTAGKPMFCNFCGASYSIKLCPRQHVNPRAAEACSQCGSRDLSQPQPKIPLLLKPLLWLLSIFPGILLLALIVGAAGLVLRRLAEDPSRLLPSMCLVLSLGLLFLLWIMLPNFIKRFLKRLLTSSSKGREGKKH
jgi:RNA polymerase subunit RPABC4/transcription elongation factor Spt4